MSQNPYEAPQDSLDSGGMETDKDARMWGMLCHITALSTFAGVPGFLGPLVIWLMKKEDYPFVDDQGKESLNFQISIFIYALISAVLIFVVIGIFLLFAISILNIIFVIVATFKANNGEYYRYPMTIRLIK